MAETSIQWTSGPNGEPGYTFNPWVGCQRVSPGCEHCYAEAYDKRVGGAPARLRSRENVPVLRWGPKADRVRTSVALWKQPLKWNREAAAAGQRRKVFCASLADVLDLHPSIEPRWRLELFSLIRQTPNLDWLLLTKRPENFRPAMEQALALSARVQDHHAYMGSPEAFEETRLWLHRWLNGEAPANVWAGATVEDRIRAGRADPLREIPARVRFLSIEPLLEDVAPVLDLRRIDWIIIGGESGAGARRFEVEWAYKLIARANRFGIAAFVKQLGAFVVDRNDVGFEAENETWAEGPEKGKPTRPRAWPTPRRIEDDINGYREEYQGADVRVHLVDRAGGDPAEWPLELRLREFPVEVRS